MGLLYVANFGTSLISYYYETPRHASVRYFLIFFADFDQIAFHNRNYIIDANKLLLFKCYVRAIFECCKCLFESFFSGVNIWKQVKAINA